jgi:pyridoxine 5-phosphate synthase
MSANKLRLGVNIDHVATLRNARGGQHPDPVRAAQLAQASGADGITIHLREDRRHIRDADVDAIKSAITIPLNFEMAATDEMRDIALRLRPHAACIVPEKRTEVTTEGGLDVLSNFNSLRSVVHVLNEVGIRTSLFIDADSAQVEASAKIGAKVVELHTGAYCEAEDEQEREMLLLKLQEAARHAHALGLEVHAGHGLCYKTVGPIAAIPEVVELNIGHFLVGEAVFIGLPEAMKKMRACMDVARAGVQA